MPSMVTGQTGQVARARSSKVHHCHAALTHLHPCCHPIGIQQPNSPSRAKIHKYKRTLTSHTLSQTWTDQCIQVSILEVQTRSFSPQPQSIPPLLAAEGTDMLIP
mmetsp:Transcript_10385/g.18309  ORF Transcript_10385/g.18309 Transcript_10385/m.18309 type:complete len:105 (-) Transcript_10385:193-507(-)